MNLESTIGIAASIFTASSLLPQFFKLLKEKKADDLSVGMLAVLFIGLSLWVWYGIQKEDWIIVIANGFSLLVNFVTLVLTLKYKKERKADDEKNCSS